MRAWHIKHADGRRMSLSAFFLEPVFDYLGSSSEMLRQVSTELRAAVDKARPCMEARVSMEYYASLVGDAATKKAALLQSLAELSGRHRLTALVLTNVQLDGTEELLAEVVRAQRKHIARVDFSNNDFSDHMPDVLGRALAECSALTHVRMRSCTLHAGEVAELMPHLAACTQLTSLDLESNFLLEGGTLAVAGALGRLPRLASLNLAGAGLNDAGARALAAALPGLPALRVVDLQDNGIGCDGCRAVADALVLCPALEELRLRNNCIKDEGCEALLHARAERPTQRMLVDVRNNNISPALMVAAQVKDLLCYDRARVTTDQPAPVTAWGANGATDALYVEEPGRWETQLRAMRSLLGTCRDENAGA